MAASRSWSPMRSTRPSDPPHEPRGPASVNQGLAISVFHTISLSPAFTSAGGQTSPHRPRLVVSRSTCSLLSPSPHANSCRIGTAVIWTVMSEVTETGSFCCENSLVGVKTKFPGDLDLFPHRKYRFSRQSVMWTKSLFFSDEVSGFSKYIFWFMSFTCTLWIYTQYCTFNLYQYSSRCLCS